MNDIYIYISDIEPVINILTERLSGRRRERERDREAERDRER